jgi:hypothetical protein
VIHHIQLEIKPISVGLFVILLKSVACSLGGRYTGKELDKIALLKEIGIIFYKANCIKTLMISGAAMNAECKLVKREELGDHVMFIGEVTEISADENIKPLVYHNGRYWRLDDNVMFHVEWDIKINRLLESLPE